jgi:hypothetical protein
MLQLVSFDEDILHLNPNQTTVRVYLPGGVKTSNRKKCPQMREEC